MTRIAALALAASVLVAGSAAADPRPTGYAGTTCDHAGIESATHHRHVNYLHQRYVGCPTAQHIARLWVHGCTQPFTGCNINDNGKYWYCTAKSTHHPGDTPEYLATCNSNHDQILVGWVRV
jgi:hypothetical protein